LALTPPFIFPALPGLGWSVIKQPTFQTRIRRPLSGRESRVNDYITAAGAPRPIWEFTLTFNFLRGPAGPVIGGTAPTARGPYSGAGYTEAGILHGFITNTRGPFFPFFYNDPTDNMTTLEFIGNGDGSTVNFPLYRAIINPLNIGSSLTEPMTAPRVVSAVYLNGAVQPGSAWSVDKGTGIITFASPPGNGVGITVDFTYWFRCRFTDDLTDFEEFMYLLHKTGLKFVSAIGDTTQAPV
jgi:hypothetical protein